MLELGKVTAVMDDQVQVQFKRTSACDKCGLCSGAGGNVTLTLKNDLNAKEGDIVEVEISHKAVTLSYLIVFGIPILTLLLGVIIASAASFSELYSIVTAAAALLVGFLIVFVLDKVFAQKDKFAPKIIRVHEQTSQTEETQ
ncbi:MAG TPA: SoxR reducing system RseC family protein [Clostridia bacterium]